MSVRLYDPTVDDMRERQELTGAPRPARLEGARIGLLANGKVNSDVLLREVAQLFVERHGCRVTLEENKRNATRPCPPELLERIAKADVDFMVTAVGD